MLNIKKAAVIGSGVMGSGIAAHLANCGIPSYLLDVVMPDLNKILKASPAHLYDADDINLITPGLLDANLEKLKECDWVIEVVPEKLEVKKALYAKIKPYIKESAWVSSNTSGLPLHEMKFRGPIVIALPFFRAYEGREVTLDGLVKKIKQFGFQPTPLLPQVFFLKYARSDQLVGRAIYRFMA